MIRVTDIHKRFGTLEVLKGVSLEVAAGEGGSTSSVERWEMARICCEPSL